MVRNFIFMAAGLIVGAASISSATALPSTTSMRDDGYTLAPFSFAKFCIDYPRECPASGGASRVVLTAPRMAQLVEINHAVNAAIIPTSDTSKFRYWHLNVAAGDCNSFAIQKRHELLVRGWPAGAVALTVARTSWGEGHLVVTVRTDQGDLVLDNLRSKIVSWRQTGYQFIMRQSENNPQFWVELHGGHIGAAYAARRIEGAEEFAEAARPIGAADVQSAELPAASVAKPVGRRLAAMANPTFAETQVADERIVGEQAVKNSLSAGDGGFNRSVPDGGSTPEGVREADAIISDIALRLAQGEITFADVAPVVASFAADIVRLIDSSLAADAKPSVSPIAVLGNPVEPARYGLM